MSPTELRIAHADNAVARISRPTFLGPTRTKIPSALGFVAFKAC